MIYNMWQWISVICIFMAKAGYALECPYCTDTHNIDVCLQDTITCHTAHSTCILTMKDWRITMGCGKPQMCAAAQNLSTTTCDGSKAFKHHDRCSLCCTGSECTQKLKEVEKGLDAVPNVLHCPICYNEIDPEKCLENIQPCAPSDVTCETFKRQSTYSSHCASANCPATHDHCLHSKHQCRVCCNDFDCLLNLYAIPPTESIFNPGNEIHPATIPPNQRTTLPPQHHPTIAKHPSSQPHATQTTLAAHAMTSSQSSVHAQATKTTKSVMTSSQPTANANCKDDSLFPCHRQKSVCQDSDMASVFCKRTCGLCSSHGATTIAPVGNSTPTPQCKDSANFQCKSTPGICEDKDLGHLFCGAFCGLCTAGAGTGTGTGTTPPQPPTTTIPPDQCFDHPTIPCSDSNALHVICSDPDLAVQCAKSCKMC